MAGIADDREGQGDVAADRLELGWAGEGLGRQPQAVVEILARLLQHLVGARVDVLAPAAQGALEHRDIELTRDGCRRAVDELMALVDDDRRMLGEHWNALEGVDCEHRVVRDDDVGLLGLKAPLDREALLAE
ncbi:unannotated protein [freshwater metagenome]|uniref:Unannotated protein n=1 Tax=freshwater metagenome TaxID=449393 RepID=A0A6J7R8H9_9ZZZZ